MPESSKGSIPFQLHVKETSIPLFPKQGAASPRLSFSLVLLEFPRQDALEELLETIFYDGIDPQGYGTKLINQHKPDYLDMVRIAEEHPDIPSESLNWEYGEVLAVSFPTSSLAVISRSREYYLGGAHGMREKKYAVIDIKENRQLNIENLLKRGAKATLQQRLEAELRAITNLEGTAPLSEGGFFEDTVEIPENFFLSSEGLGFHWDPYEIAPYVMGPIEVFLPAENVRDLLRTDIFS
ncbi:MAG: RsiV family protein [Spirochaetaceae bacterium]|nr:RsiV family protein [Spirochaetaceae bacterium]